MTNSSSPEPDPEAVAMTHLEVEQLLAALQRLPSRDREIVALRCGGQLSYREIGGLLGLSENTATAAAHRAMGHLRDLLEDRR
jgi:RNA polymerase sigma-70 factor (ECF subfamily)